ncbi:phosphatidate phosphatase PAH2-like isoform X2 [Musa acuminata AAA Group]|uniref:phosphatidate phosphatase PAH2-like isoform X2 n=1 Tax=Musa acuminata AAA Group TaxID=214697 RepID=UPI0031E3CB49
MYAVGKIGSYISRGVYTVSGPFHPFGGAVDIIVVQQQDGSYKSSPWYVRFGKFQGVLKTKEKIVRISVNGVEAGFNMFLDHKGEAFFLRDAEAGEPEPVLSPPTSGDETEERVKNGGFKKIRSFDVEGGQKELVTRVDNGNGKLVTRTSSRRSAILGLMFGRKSIKENGKGGNVDRVSSMERAEIAADLLEVKWSTNLKPNDQRSDSTQVKSSEDSEINVCVADEEHDSQTILPNDDLHGDEKLVSHGEGMDDDFRISISSRSCSEEERDNDPSCPRVTEETTETYTSETGDREISDQSNSEFVFRNPIVEPNLDFDATSCDAFVSHDEEIGDAHRNLMLSEKNSEEETSQEMVVQISTLVVSDTTDRNNLISESVTTQSDKIDTQNPGSAAYYDDTQQLHTGSSVGSTGGIFTCDSDRNGITSSSYHETVERSVTRINFSDDKPSGHLDFLSIGAEQCENGFLCDTSNMVQEVNDLLASSASLSKENSDCCHDQGLETSRVSESYVFEKLQCDYTRNGAFEDSDNSVFITESVSNLSSEQFSSCIPSLYNPQLLSCEDEVISTDVIAEESSHDKETDFQQIDLFGNHHQMRERKAAQVTSFPFYVSNDPLNSGSSAESHSICDIPNSCNSSNVTQEIGNFDVGINLKRSYSFEEINVAQDFGISSPTEVAEYHVPCSDILEDVQFPFSDIDNFNMKDIDAELSNNNKVVHAEHQLTSTACCDLEEQDLQIKNPKQPLEGISDVLISPSSPISIQGCKTSSREPELSSRSLPVIRSHIKDLEGSDLCSMSCSLESKTDICKLDMLKNEDSSSSRLVAELQTEAMLGYTSVAAATASSAQNEEEQKGTLANPTVELSLCKQLLFEGMGAGAARQVFDAEKEIILEPQGMIPVDGDEEKNGASRSITPSRGSWLWPFLKRSKTISDAHATSKGTNEMDVDLASQGIGNMTQQSDMLQAKNSKKVQSLTPTSDEIASLNLKEGQNVVTFSFSTPVLGSQQVDARIYLWKWNTRIVISDVDGTITRSDVLGQFMPLVGIDWSQTGVAHLFSAIKDNGYQLLFLSARAISQAHLTRQFLFNLKQDGKALPDGPVVISPDGLFPSLYREVIRRAPHEFKISCLEAIKALFPPDCNPFYAGFGNRDTDEISYLKVGIPIGKIFIINPKGQVAVNRRVDTRSYASLHELVNGIFPPMSSLEQEDYNSWNFWKLPLPEVEI